MLGFWAAGSPAQEPPVRHRLSLNSPSCSKTDFTTPNLLVTTCSLKTVSFSLPWREQQFVPLSVYVPEMLHPCFLCCLSGESWKASLMLPLSSPWQVSYQNIWKTIMTTYNILIADQQDWLSFLNVFTCFTLAVFSVFTCLTLAALRALQIYMKR